MRRAIVTGGTGGIGSAIVERLLAQLPEEDHVVSWRRGMVYDRADILVNCAGVNWPQPIESCTAFRDTMEVNVELPMTLIARYAPGMVERGWGRIVNISSLWAFRGQYKRFAYGASKAALDALTRTAALEYAPHVLVNSVAPGFVDTPMTRRNLDEAAIIEVEQRTPLGRLARPEEVAELVAWLCSERNTFVTGQRLVVDGGISI